jgi:ABC-2 type transport system ATP-binding protein
MAYVSISHLVKRFGPITAVDDVSFEVERGEVLGFLGPNGAGKSTTMKMLTGFLSPDSGRVTIGGDDIAERPLAAKRRLGYLPEGAPLYGDMTCASFLDFIAEVRGFRGDEKRRRVRETIDKVNLGGVVNQPIETLSKGYKRRVGLAQAILHDPEVLVLDEPTSGLDVPARAELHGLLRELRTAGTTVLLATHDMAEAESLCDRVMIVLRGRTVAVASPTELTAAGSGLSTVSVRTTRATFAHGGEGLPGVQQRIADGSYTRWLSDDPAATVTAVLASIEREGDELVDLRVERPSLEERFLELTREEVGT